MPRETPSPIDLSGPALLGPGGLRWASVVIATATLFLLLTNAVALRDWINEQKPSPAQAYAASAADAWVGLTDRIGIGAPRAAMHGAWKKVEAARFKGQAPADDAGQDGA